MLIIYKEFESHQRSILEISDILRYQVIDLIWLRYHAHLAELWYGKYLIVPFWFTPAAYQAPFSLAMGVMARLRLAKIRTMARPNSPVMLLKRPKKV